MFFDLNPKEQIKDIYGRQKELKQLSDSLKNKERLVVIYGLRRVGKTSLIHATLNTKDFSYIFIDIKEIYFEHGSVPVTEIAELIASEFVRFTDKLGFNDEAFEVSSGGGSGLAELLKDINGWCKQKKIFFIIALDEAQYLRYGGKVRYDGIIAWSVDNLTNIGFVLTGSEVGVLKDFLSYDDVDAPLYGRFRSEIYLDRFDRAKCAEFLKKGFDEYNKKVNTEDLDEAADKIGGIVGWLTYYGYYRAVSGLSHKDAMGKVFDEGSKIALKEIEALISHSRKRYINILRAVAEGVSTWTEIKAYVSAKSGSISDTILSSLLQNLLKLGIVERDSKDEYVIIDPVIRYLATKIKFKTKVQK